MLSLGLAFLAAAGAAAADEPVKREPLEGSRLSRCVETDVWDTDKTRKAQVVFGDCVIKKHFTTAQHFVLTPNMDKSAWRKDVATVADGYCLVAVTDGFDAQMTFPVDTMRYALADALVRKEFSAAPATSFKDAAPLEQPKFDEADYVPEPGEKPRKGELEKLKEGREKQIALIYLAGFGECVVRADPANSHALLITEPTSTQEAAAFKAMMSAFGGCLTVGHRLEFNKATLRGTIAMNYYRLAHAPRIVTATAGATK